MKSVGSGHNTKHTQRDFWARLLVAALIMGMSSIAQAAPLNLVLEDAPDISSAFINVDYDSTADILTASGFAQQLDDDGIGIPFAIAGGSFDLVASILDDGSLGGGTLAIGGTVSGLGFNSGTLLTGNLSVLGFDQANDPLEFLFDVTGGDAAALYGDLGAIILSNTGFGGSWTNDFTSAPFAALADVGVSAVPVPAALWLFGSALIGLLGVGGHTRRKQNS